MWAAHSHLNYSCPHLSKDEEMSPKADLQALHSYTNCVRDAPNTTYHLYTSGLPAVLSVPKQHFFNDFFNKTTDFWFKAICTVVVWIRNVPTGSWTGTLSPCWWCCAVCGRLKNSQQVMWKNNFLVTLSPFSQVFGKFLFCHCILLIVSAFRIKSLEDIPTAKWILSPSHLTFNKDRFRLTPLPTCLLLRTFSSVSAHWWKRALFPCVC